MHKTFDSPSASLNEQQCQNKTTITNFLKGKTGIYTILNKDPALAKYTGHIDYIIDGKTINGTDLHPKGGILKIEIWELN